MWCDLIKFTCIQKADGTTTCAGVWDVSEEHGSVEISNCTMLCFAGGALIGYTATTSTTSPIKGILLIYLGSL